MTCILCSRAEDCENVGDWNLLRLLCSELDIDFDKVLDNPVSTLAVPSCKECLHILHQIHRIQSVLANVRLELTEIKCQIRERVNVLRDPWGGLPEGSPANRLRREIVRWALDPPEIGVIGGGNGLNFHPGTSYGETDRLKLTLTKNSRTLEPSDLPLEPQSLKYVHRCDSCLPNNVTFRDVNRYFAHLYFIHKSPDIVICSTPSLSEEYSCETCGEPCSDATKETLHKKCVSVPPPQNQADIDPLFDHEMQDVEPNVQNGEEIENLTVELKIPESVPQPPQKQPRKNARVPYTVTCSDCMKIFTSRDKLTHHRKKTHLKEKGRDYVCEFCPESRYTSLPPLINHIIKIHETDTEPEDKRLSCRQCRLEFVTSFMLKRHLEGHKVEATKPLFCDLCYLHFSAKKEAALANHKLGHGSKELAFYCKGEGCTRRFQTPVILRRHERTAHPELLIYRCPLCEEVYSVKEFLDTHLKTHAGVEGDEGPFGCCTCTAKFIARAGLADHLRTHTGEGTFQCKDCSNYFESKLKLNIHKAKEHGAKRAFVCTICSKGYHTNAELYRHHQRAHEDPALADLPDKKKACVYCGLELSCASVRWKHEVDFHTRKTKICEVCGEEMLIYRYKRHKEAHDKRKNFACYFCDRRFGMSYSLHCHLFTHTKERPYICEFCRADFNQNHCLKAHMRKVHGFRD